MKMKSVIACLMLLLLPVGALAMSHGDGKSMDHDKMEMDTSMDHDKMDKSMDHDKMDKSMDHDKMDKSMDHDKMEMGGMDHDMSGMIMLGSEEVKGVKAMFHLEDVREEMAKHGQPFTHHLMVNFVDVATGKAIEKGVVQVKVTDPQKKVSDKKSLMGMDGHFGVDLVLDQEGTYHFKIATKLEDGKKRMFHPHHKF